MKAYATALVAAAAIWVVAQANAQSGCYRSMIQEPSPFLGNGGEIIILADGTIWKEISYQYLYLYEYYPTVVVCPARGTMILKDNIFTIQRLR